MSNKIIPTTQERRNIVDRIRMSDTEQNIREDFRDIYLYLSLSEGFDSLDLQTKARMAILLRDAASLVEAAIQEINFELSAT